MSGKYPLGTWFIFSAYPTLFQLPFYSQGLCKHSAFVQLLLLVRSILILYTPKCWVWDQACRSVWFEYPKNRRQQLEKTWSPGYSEGQCFHCRCWNHPRTRQAGMLHCLPIIAITHWEPPHMRSAANSWRLIVVPQGIRYFLEPCFVSNATETFSTCSMLLISWYWTPGNFANVECWQSSTRLGTRTIQLHIIKIE